MCAIGTIEETVGALFDESDLVIEDLLALLGTQMAH